MSSKPLTLPLDFLNFFKIGKTLADLPKEKRLSYYTELFSGGGGLGLTEILRAASHQMDVDFGNGNTPPSSEIRDSIKLLAARLKQIQEEEKERNQSSSPPLPVSEFPKWPFPTGRAHKPKDSS